MPDENGDPLNPASAAYDVHMHVLVGNETQMPASLCPSCGQRHDMATHPTEDVAPRPGDVSVCIRCYAVNVFSADRTLRKPTDAEVQAMKASDSWPQVQRMVRAMIRVKARNA